MSYAAKLRDPRWQRKRLEILQRDNWTCRHCNAKDKPLQVHHAIYLRIDPWEYPDHLLQTLCDECHSERGPLAEKIANAVRIALMNVPTSRMLEVATRVCNEAMLEIEVDV